MHRCNKHTTVMISRVRGELGHVVHYESARKVLCSACFIWPWAHVIDEKVFQSSNQTFVYSLRYAEAFDRLYQFRNQELPKGAKSLPLAKSLKTCNPIMQGF